MYAVKQFDLHVISIHGVNCARSTKIYILNYCTVIYLEVQCHTYYTETFLRHLFIILF